MSKSVKYFYIDKPVDVKFEYNIEPDIRLDKEQMEILGRLFTKLPKEIPVKLSSLKTASRMMLEARGGFTNATSKEIEEVETETISAFGIHKAFELDTIVLYHDASCSLQYNFDGVRALPFGDEEDISAGDVISYCGRLLVTVTVGEDGQFFCVPFQDIEYDI